MGREQNVAVDNYNTDFNYSKSHKRNHELKTKVVRIVCISFRDLRYNHHRGLKSWREDVNTILNYIAVNSYVELSRIDIYKSTCIRSSKFSSRSLYFNVEWNQSGASNFLEDSRIFIPCVLL